MNTVVPDKAKQKVFQAFHSSIPQLVLFPTSSTYVGYGIVSSCHGPTRAEETVKVNSWFPGYSNKVYFPCTTYARKKYTLFWFAVHCKPIFQV